MAAVLVRLNSEAIEATWPRIETMIDAACERSSGRYSAPVVKAYAQRGAWQIWIALDEQGVCAVAASSINTYDTGLKSIAIRFGTGRKRRQWQHFMEDVVAWGKSQGCTMAEGNFRLGWRRALPGWTHTHDSLERAL